MRNAKALQAAGWRKSMKVFAEDLKKSSKGIGKAVQQVLVYASEDYLRYVQDNKDRLPYYTANLHDSIATAVAASGRIIKARYLPKEATRPQTAAGRKRIVGEQEAIRAVRLYRPGRTGVSSTLFVAVPYAEGANRDGEIRRVFRGREYMTRNHHPGYLQWLEDTFVSSMDSGLRILEFSKYDGKEALINWAAYRRAKLGEL